MNLITICFFCCQQVNEKVIHRPQDPWVIRSVLDQQVRMITLVLHEDAFVAYNTENCALYKLWRGGVHWDGAVFNNIKTVQPESWGEAYIEEPIDGNPWYVEKNDKKEVVHPRFRGYQLENNQITFHYSITLSNEKEIDIFERPEFIPNLSGQVGFERTFETKGLPTGHYLWNGDIRLPFNSKEMKAFSFEAFSVSNKEAYTRTATGSGSQYWLDRSGCNTCHKEKEKMIGPAYQAIAEKYEKDKETVAQLIQKVKSGGAGVWGQVPMNPHPNLTERDIKRMIDYIFSLKPKKNTKRRKVSKGMSIEEKNVKAGFGAALDKLHPSLDVQTIRPDWFRPRVGGMDFLPDGRLLVSTWDSIGGVYALSGVEMGDTSEIKIERIAAGLSEPLGLKVVGEDIFVLQKHELTQLIDHDGDGVTDEYRSICNSFDATPDFHEFSYGLEYKDGFFYANLGLAMRLMSHELQLPDRGAAIKISMDGNFSKVAEGLRQANGIGFGLEGELFITENQGQWVPACKVIHLKEGDFHGCQYGTGDRYQGREMTPPAVWLPQDDIGNSPGQPVLIKKGVYKNQLLHGEVTHGGLKRVFLEKVDGAFQGCVFRFTQGLEAGINRMVWGPDEALYVGGVGMNGNWGWKGNQFGLQKVVFTEKKTFEILSIRAQPDGFELEFTEPIAEEQALEMANYAVQQWRYEPTSGYGGPKLDQENLLVHKIEWLDNTQKIRLTVPGLKEGFVIYFLLNEQLKSNSGQSLWTGEAWYTLNAIPEKTLQ